MSIPASIILYLRDLEEPSAHPSGDPKHNIELDKRKHFTCFERLELETFLVFHILLRPTAFTVKVLGCSSLFSLTWRDFMVEQKHPQERLWGGTEAPKRGPFNGTRLVARIFSCHLSISGNHGFT
ncbi:hypothetical protein VNO80_00847 [Phaseolus coccineus]|uniref:Uncharacterized protein n=1 Tax=Phaseolus coccineus TaxID=3886 RepID=A0AAN9RQL4_PHACN